MKYVLFTGATGCLGGACIKTLSDSGRWTVFALGTNEKELMRLGALPHVLPVRCDITEACSVENARSFVAGHTQKLDAIVNFAGLTAFASAVEGDVVRDTEKLLAVNVIGMVRINKEFFPMLQEGAGRILNCSSEAGWMTAQPFAAPYFLSKRAVEAYSDSLRRELMFLRIKVVKIQPGSFKSGLTDNICKGYDLAVENTTHYRNLLVKMKPLMTQELAHKNDPAHLAQVVLKALETKHPRIRYRVGTGKLLALLEVLPECGIDLAYRLFFKLKMKDRHS